MVVARRDDLGVLVEMGAGSEDAAEKQGGVDGGNLGIAPGLAGFDVVEVGEEAVVVGEGVAVES